jgi:3-isopropylmalate/(R)-2-methylmalate dehydratase small subunit
MNWIFGNNINTDLITPGRYNITTDAIELAKIVFIEHRPEFAKTVKNGDFIIAGNNFGCGSSRETAVTALRACGIKAIIAKSFARIFYRNCINQGLLAIIADTKNIELNDKIKIDIKKQFVTNISKKKEIKAIIPPLMVKLYESGGIISYLKKNGLSSLQKLFAI